MSSSAAAPSEFRLATGRVTALLGPETARRDLLGRLDPADPRTVLTVTSATGRSVADRIAALTLAASRRPVLVLVDRMTDGLAAGDRRAVLAMLGTLAAGGPAVLVDDADPVAALAVAHGALRVGADGSVQTENVESALDAEALYRAS